MFRLMVPSGYGPRCWLEGPVGGTPDVALVRKHNSYDSCCRATLPPFIDGLIFNGVAQNFCHLGDFFVVSDSMKKVLERRAGCTFEAKRIQTNRPDDNFWAMKVTTRIDCIQPDLSFAKEPMWSSEPPKRFRELGQEIKLSDEMAPYFANKGVDTYYAYPSYGVTSVSLDFSSVPHGVRLFEPLYWPRFLVIDDAFSRELQDQIEGGTWGYHFWTLGFDDVSGEHHKMMTDLR